MSFHNPQPESPRPEGAQDCRVPVSNVHIFMTRGAESPEVLGLGGSSGALIPRPHQVAGVAPPLGPSAPPLPPPEVGAAGRTGAQAQSGCGGLGGAGPNGF